MKCENCSSKHDGSYGSGRFCSSKCARGFSTKAKRKEINRKVSKTLTINKKEWSYKAGRVCLCCDKVIPRYNAYFCSSKCHSDYKYLQFVKNWKKNRHKKHKCNTSKHIKRYLKEKYGNKCMKCGWDKTNSITGNVPIHVHHVDGDFQNDMEQNLELLCPNCHSLTCNFGSINTGKSTRERY